MHSVAAVETEMVLRRAMVQDAEAIAKVRIGDVVKELIPFYVVAIALLLGFAYLPWLTLR